MATKSVLFFKSAIKLVDLTEGGLVGSLSVGLGNDRKTISEMRITMVEGASISQFMFLMSFGSPLEVIIYDVINKKELMSLGKFAIVGAKIGGSVITLKMTQVINIAKSYYSSTWNFKEGSKIIKDLLQNSNFNILGLNTNKAQIDKMAELNTVYTSGRKDILSNIEDIASCYLDEGFVYSIYQDEKSIIQVRSQCSLRKNTNSFAVRNHSTIDNDKLDNGIKETTLAKIKTILKSDVVITAGLEDELPGRCTWKNGNLNLFQFYTEFKGSQNYLEGALPVYKPVYLGLDASSDVNDLTHMTHIEKLQALTKDARKLQEFIKAEFTIGLDNSSDVPLDKINTLPKLGQTFFVCANCNPASFYTGLYLISKISYEANGYTAKVAYKCISNSLNTKAAATGFTNDVVFYY